MGRNSPFKFENRVFTKKRLDELLVKMGMKTPPEEEMDDGNSETGGSSKENDDENHMELGSVEGSSIFSLDSNLRSQKALSSVSDIEGAFSDDDEVVDVSNSEVVMEIDGAVLNVESNHNSDQDT